MSPMGDIASCRLYGFSEEQGGWWAVVGWLPFLPCIKWLYICDCVCFKLSWTWKLQSREGNRTRFRQIRLQDSEAEFIAKCKAPWEAHRCFPGSIFEITEIDFDCCITTAWKVSYRSWIRNTSEYSPQCSTCLWTCRRACVLFCFLTYLVYSHPKSDSSA